MANCRQPAIPPAHAFQANGGMSRAGFLAMRAWQKFGRPGTSPHSPGNHDQSEPASPSGSLRSMAASRTRPSGLASTPPSGADVSDGVEPQRAHARRSAHTAGISTQRLRVTALHPPTAHGRQRTLRRGRPQTHLGRRTVSQPIGIRHITLLFWRQNKAPEHPCPTRAQSYGLRTWFRSIRACSRPPNGASFCP